MRMQETSRSAACQSFFLSSTTLSWQMTLQSEQTIAEFIFSGSLCVCGGSRRVCKDFQLTFSSRSIFWFRNNTLLWVASCFPGFIEELTPGGSVAHGPGLSERKPFALASDTFWGNFPNILKLSDLCRGVILHLNSLIALFLSGDLSKPLI